MRPVRAATLESTILNRPALLPVPKCFYSVGQRQPLGVLRRKRTIPKPSPRLQVRELVCRPIQLPRPGVEVVEEQGGFFL